ncbi:MAG: folate-binding protein [Alphaproteobacteria bacterium]|nr:folate-binding protein [Alphaproteobacteria bacterium]
MTPLLNTTRSIIRITGDDRVSFLQGILTNDIAKLNGDKIQFAALLSPQGKILNDMFVVAWDNAILLDTGAAFADALIKRLALYKLRAKVTIEDASAELAVTQDATGLPDPRHPELPHRLYAPTSGYATPLSDHPTLALGIPELGRDFAPEQVVAMDAGYDLLHAISFTKGCYVGQEVTARMHYKNIARRGFYLLEHDTMPPRLALLRFEDVEVENGMATVDNITYRATLPAWMLPKLTRFKSGPQNQ